MFNERANEAIATDPISFHRNSRKGRFFFSCINQSVMLIVKMWFKIFHSQMCLKICFRGVKEITVSAENVSIHFHWGKGFYMSFNFMLFLWDLTFLAVKSPSKVYFIDEGYHHAWFGPEGNCGSSPKLHQSLNPHPALCPFVRNLLSKKVLCPINTAIFNLFPPVNFTPAVISILCIVKAEYC